MNLEFASSMSSDIRPNKNSSTHSSTNIYDTPVNVNASNALQKSLSVSDSVSGRSMRQELLKIKTVSKHLFNLSIINVFVKVVTKLYECFY